MFNGEHFYHGHIRNAVTTFGTIFNGIRIVRQEGSDTQQILVPLSYGPKQKFLTRILEAPNLEPGARPVEIVLPRMAFELTSVTYDAGRTLPRTQPVSSGKQRSFISAPYQLGFTLSVMVKNQEDGLQIIEQILPYFAPDFSLTINEMPELGVKRDLQLVMDSVSVAEEYEGEFGKRLVVIWDLSFTMRINLWGDVSQVSRIKTLIQNIYAPSGEGTTITTTPLPSGTPWTEATDFMQEFDTRE